MFDAYISGTVFTARLKDACELYFIAHLVAQLHGDLLSHENKNYVKIKHYRPYITVYLVC